MTVISLTCKIHKMRVELSNSLFYGSSNEEVHEATIFQRVVTTLFPWLVKENVNP